MHRSSVVIVLSGALLAGFCGSRAAARPAADPAARASAKPCLPARGLVVANTIRRSLKDGSEVTEPLADGGPDHTLRQAGAHDDRYDGPADRRHRR